jgi:hypothetical protein
VANLTYSPTTNSIKSHTTRRRRAWPRILAWIVGLPLLVIALYLLIGWPWLSRWGATDTEAEQVLPGDELVPNPALVTTKAVTINALPEAVYPWLLQLGVDRGGMYSYLWVENWLLRLNVQNSDEIRPEWQNMQVGDFIRFTPPGYALNPGPGFYVMALEPNRALVACFGIENQPVDCSNGATWQFVLEPQEGSTTRLLLRTRSASPGAAIGMPGTKDSAMAMLTGKLASIFPFYMERKMLLNIKEQAEKSAARHVLSSIPASQ